MQVSAQYSHVPPLPPIPLTDGSTANRHRASFSKPRAPGSSSHGLVKPRSSSSDSKRLKPAFTTCLSYPEPMPLSTAALDQQDSSDLQRNQRRSKVEALTKLDRAGPAVFQLSSGPTATSFLPAAQPTAGPSGPSPSRNPLLRPAVSNPPFSLDTVRTEAPRKPPLRSGTRLFGLEECPVFYPNPDEFRDPMAYIDSIGPIAKPYGICKIVPPEGWRMPFSLETETFRFKTRLQRLNSLEAASRAKVNFLEQLTTFHLQQGDSKVTIPVIDRKPIDLWRLRKEVNKLGGYIEVERLKGWPVITQTLGLHPSYAFNLKSAYIRIILPFDTFKVRAKSVSASPLTPVPSTTMSKPPSFVAESPLSPTLPSRMRGMRSSRAPRTGSDPGKKGKSATPPETSHSLPPYSGASLFGDAPINPASAGAVIASKVSIPGFSSRDGSESELSDEDLSPPPKPLTKAAVPDEYQKGEVSCIGLGLANGRFAKYAVADMPRTRYCFVTDVIEVSASPPQPRKSLSRARFPYLLPGPTSGFSTCQQRLVLYPLPAQSRRRLRL